MKIIKSLSLTIIFLTFFLPVFSQNQTLTFPIPQRQVQKSLQLPENLDTLKQDYFLIYQFKLNDGKANHISLIATYPQKLPEVYYQFAESKLKWLDFSEVSPNPKSGYYGTSLKLLQKAEKPREEKSTYTKRLAFFMACVEHYSTLSKEDYDYMKKNWPEMAIVVQIEKDLTISVHDFYEDDQNMKDETYQRILTDLISNIKKCSVNVNFIGDTYNIKVEFRKGEL